MNPREFGGYGFTREKWSIFYRLHLRVLEGLEGKVMYSQHNRILETHLGHEACAVVDRITQSHTLATGTRRLIILLLKPEEIVP